MTIFFAWLVLALIVGAAASQRGRAGIGWFVLSLVISPLITCPLVFLLPRRVVDQHSISPTIKGFGVVLLIGGLILIAMFVVSLLVIVQHGGA